MDIDEDAQLQLALALSMQDAYQNDKHDDEITPSFVPNGHHRDAEIDQDKPNQFQEPIVSTPTDVGAQHGKSTTHANPSNKSTTKQQQRKQSTKKLPPFSPSPSEVERCFQELTSRGRSSITIEDIVNVGTKLGVDIDANKAASMIEYLLEHRIASHNLSFDAFKAITEHFRVE